MKEIFYDWGGLNNSIFYAINSIHGEFYDQFMLFGSMLGKYKIFPVYLLLLASFALFMGKRIKEKSPTEYITFRNKWREVMLVLVISFLTNMLWVSPLKDFFQYPRPFVALPQDSFIMLQSSIAPAESPLTSFPSGHSIFSMMMVAGLWPALSKCGRYMGMFFLAWVGISRIALGMHFPMDVLTGFTLSCLVVVIVRMAVRKILKS